MTMNPLGFTAFLWGAWSEVSGQNHKISAVCSTDSAIRKCTRFPPLAFARRPAVPAPVLNTFRASEHQGYQLAHLSHPTEVIRYTIVLVFRKQTPGSYWILYCSALQLPSHATLIR